MDRPLGAVGDPHLLAVIFVEAEGRESIGRVAAAAAREVTARGNLHTRLYTTFRFVNRP